MVCIPTCYTDASFEVSALNVTMTGQLIQVIEANELVDIPRENNYEVVATAAPKRYSISAPFLRRFILILLAGMTKLTSRGGKPRSRNCWKIADNCDGT